MFNIIVPAHNEQAYIGPTLSGLLAQDDCAPSGLRAIVVANGCRDATAKTARGFIERFTARGWELRVIETPIGNKPAALNLADAETAPGPRAYLDADVICSPTLLGKLAEILDSPEPRYASGIFTIAPPASRVSRLYARLWLKLPFMTSGVPGCGLFAMNPSGRARWDIFPDVIADDLYARHSFTPEERFRAEAEFSWVLAEGFAALVRVRRRWDMGNRQLRERFPELTANEAKVPMTPRDHLRLMLGQPASYAVYSAVALASRLGARDRVGWARGR
ncbi:glycosyltransferase [Tropicimonas sp. TH_r6]|uniref:glycosyltransferase n=1 Tax=Tropicimonas sp. TH_r6 TaxID=3082085 RepID=UPI002952C161|nr:glycosyltransferase [Tropicimonas sp. TH_r6]MDV7141165.1 glycosyltransferase [Tropicimonas sp. TH_r6]